MDEWKAVSEKLVVTSAISAAVAGVHGCAKWCVYEYVGGRGGGGVKCSGG